MRHFAAFAGCVPCPDVRSRGTFGPCGRLGAGLRPFSFRRARIFRTNDQCGVRYLAICAVCVPARSCCLIRVHAGYGDTDRVTQGGTTGRSVLIWVCEGTWRASVDAARQLAPSDARITLLHVTSAAVPDAAHGAYRARSRSCGHEPRRESARSRRRAGSRDRRGMRAARRPGPPRSPYCAFMSLLFRS